MDAFPTRSFYGHVPKGHVVIVPDGDISDVDIEGSDTSEGEGGAADDAECPFRVEYDKDDDTEDDVDTFCGAQATASSTPRWRCKDSTFVAEEFTWMSSFSDHQRVTSHR